MKHVQNLCFSLWIKSRRLKCSPSDGSVPMYMVSKMNDPVPNNFNTYLKQEKIILDPPCKECSQCTEPSACKFKSLRPCSFSPFIMLTRQIVHLTICLLLLLLLTAPAMSMLSICHLLGCPWCLLTFYGC